MSKEEILDYVWKYSEIPSEATKYFDDLDFVIQMLEKESAIMYDLPIEIQKKVLLKDYKYIKEVYDIGELLQDETFAKELVDKNNDVLLELRGASVKNDYINNLIISYIKGDKEPEYGTKLYKRMSNDPMVLYSFGTQEIQQNKDIIQYMLDIDVGYFKKIKNKDIIENKNKYLIEYLIKQPWNFEEYYDEIKDIMTPELLESALKYNFQNYKLIDKDNPLMEQFYKSIERIKQIRPELNMENPSLRYELLMDTNFIKMDINIINSLLEYTNNNVDKVIEISKNGGLDYLLKYIEIYNKLYGNTLENIQYAISSFESIKELLVNTNNLENIKVDDDTLKTIISTKNKFEINSINDLQNSDNIIKQYYINKINTSNSLEDIRNLYLEIFFNSSFKEFEDFYKEYCNNNIYELYNYIKVKNITSPIIEKFMSRYEIFYKINNTDSLIDLKSLFNNIPIINCDIGELKQEITKLYSKIYKDEMLNLDDPSLEHFEYKGVDLINLNGKEFNLCIHRLFNFDFEMNSITNEIINNPEKWSSIEGSNTISTTLITDKKIAAIFRPLQKSAATDFILLDTEEKRLEYENKKIKEATEIYEGELLQEIDENAVFYGFTNLSSEGIIKMDSTDMMIEHGKGHLESNSSNCRMRSSDDLAYWTDPGYWNEVLQKRKETNIDIANELRNQNTTDKILPSCIVCFDNKINENSLLAAKTHGIPILMINRQQYLDLNKQKLEKAKQEFSKSLSLEAIKEIFYRQPYYKIVQDIPNIISIINEISDISYIDKVKSLKYLAFLGQHFIEQSDGYIIDVPVEKYNEQIKGYLQVINAKLQEYNNLIMMEESNNTYSENLEIGTKKM